MAVIGSGGAGIAQGDYSTQAKAYGYSWVAVPGNASTFSA